MLIYFIKIKKMFNGNVVSLKRILWNVMNHPLSQGLTYEIAAGHAVEAIRLVGATLAYEKKTTNPKLVINSYKALLPPDIINIRGARAFINKDDDESKAIALTQATDLYHSSAECKDENKQSCIGSEATYMTSAGVITTSFPNGYVEIAYERLTQDEDGFPMVPDNQDFLLAVEYYILFRYLAPLYDIGKITDKAFGRIEQQKCWYMGAANSDMMIGNMDHAEAMFNSINRLIINSGAQRNFFKFMGKNERLKRY
jgi:hypothetical protein